MRDWVTRDWFERRNVEEKERPRRRQGKANERKILGLKDLTPTPLFFVSVASKGVSFAVSLLFATLAGRAISVAAKGLMGTTCRRESNGWA
jgi:hypothetical protein